MLKLDKNLLETYTRLVPDLVGDETFWRNYFYEIERYFSEIGQLSRIKGKLSDEEIQRRQHYVDVMYSQPYISEPENESQNDEAGTRITLPTQMEMMTLNKGDSVEILDGGNVEEE